LILNYRLFDGIPALPKNFSSKGSEIKSEPANGFMPNAFDGNIFEGLSCGQIRDRCCSGLDCPF
jgi:hypothetical protein